VHFKSHHEDASPFPYIALEGVDGVGKSTIRKRVARYLKEQKYPVLEIGQHAWLNITAARIILDARERRRALQEEDIVNAYYLDKQLHARYNILPNNEKAVILADRSVISDAVYQEALYGIPADETLNLYIRANQLFPTLLIYVSAEIETAIHRISRRGKHRRHYEKEADLRQISSIYDSVLSSRGKEICNNIIIFKNEREDLDNNLSNSLFPLLDNILRDCLSRTTI